MITVNENIVEKSIDFFNRFVYSLYMGFLIMIMFFGFFFGGICAYIAHEKHRNAGPWFIMGFFFGLLGLIIVGWCSE